MAFPIGAAIASGVGGAIGGRAGGAVADKVSAPLAMVGKSAELLSEKLLGPIKPLALFNNALNSVSSGSSVYAKSLGILSNTLGQVFTPIFLKFSAAVLTASDWLSNKLAPALDQWYQDVSDVLDPAIQLAAEGLTQLYDATVTLINGFRILAKTGAIGSAVTVLGGGIAGALVNLVAGALANAPSDQGVKDRVKANERLSAQELLASLQRGGSSTSLTGAAAAAQQKALGMTPFERKQLEELTKIANNTAKAANKPDGPAAPPGAVKAQPARAG